MAIEYINYNRSNDYGSAVRQVLFHLETGLDSGQKILKTLQLMIDGDGSQDSDYALIATLYGFASPAVARTFYNEWLSAIGKITTNDSVTNVNAALVKLCSELR